MDITKIIEAIIGLILAVLTTFIIPLIKSKVSAEKLSELEKWVKIGVQAAEMIYTESGCGIEKKRYVTEYILHKLSEKNITVSIDDINNCIESAVLEINRQTY